MNRTRRTVRISIALGLALTLGLLAACAGEATETASGPKTASSAAPVTPPTVQLTAPVAGATVPSGTVTVAVETTGLEFVMPGGTNVAGQGHVHFTLDDRPLVMSVEKQAELEDVEPGTHTLEAELVQNDTESFDPPVKQKIEFTVE